MMLLLSLALAQTCQTYSAQCTCYPAVPFEGYQMYVTEKCDGKEASFKYGETQYDTVELCLAAAAADKNCQSLN